MFLLSLVIFTQEVTYNEVLIVIQYFFTLRKVVVDQETILLLYHTVSHR